MLLIKHKIDLRSSLQLVRRISNTLTKFQVNVTKTDLASKDNQSSPPEAESDGKQNDDSQPLEEYSALADRFSKILEEKISNSTPSLTKTDPTISKLFKKYNESIDAPVASYLKSEPLLAANRHAKDIYESKPWTGTESNVDANLRMIIDSTPKSKRIKRKDLFDIKELALDYKLKDKTDETPKDNFHELYKERLLGPSMLLSNSPSSAVDLIGSVAAAKINAHIDQSTGTFNAPEMVLVRGKPLKKEHLQNCNDSNYFINQILNTQEVLPPWIESQQTLAGQIELLRKDIDNIWFNWFINKSPLANQIHSSSANSESSILVILKKFETKFTPAFIYALPDPDVQYLEERIKTINNSIRSYNLQAPSSHLHKFKLLPQNEINQAYLRSIDTFASKFPEWFEKNKNKRSANAQLVKDRSGGGLLNLFDGGPSGLSQGLETIEVPVRQLDTKLHLWKAVKDIFSK